MKKYICLSFGYVYDPALRDIDSRIESNTAFEEIPNDWQCSICFGGKDDFALVEEGTQVRKRRFL